MSVEINDYLCQPRDSRRDRQLLQRLRELSEEDRYEIVRKLLQQNKGIGLFIASSSLRQKRYFQEILEMGFKEGDASTILPWLECAVPKLGFRNVIVSLDNRMNTDLVGVDNAMYWMSRFKPQNDSKADLAWNRIKARRREIANLQQSHSIKKIL
jgi:hypothetical protein